MTIKFISCVFMFTVLSACGKTDGPPAPKVAAPDTHPVKNVDALPSGAIQDGARTMNRASDLGKSLEQQKQDRDKEAETQNK